MDAYQCWIAHSQQQSHRAIQLTQSVWDAADSAILPFDHQSEQEDLSTHITAADLGQDALTM